MKIAIDARFYRNTTGGIGRYTRALLHELEKLDRDNQYTIYITPEDDAEYDLRAKNFQKVISPISHYSIAEQTKFLNILNRGKFDLVHFTNFNHPILYRGKFVITIHDLTLMLYPSFSAKRSFIKKWGLGITMKNAIKKAQKIIAISKATKKDLVKVLQADPAKIEVVYEGIDPQYNTRPIVYRLSSLAKYKINKPYLLFISQWRPHKGILQLVEAFEILKKQFKIPHQLVIVGKPNPDFPEIPKAISHSSFVKDIITPGFVDEEDLPELYRQAELFVFPSHYEGFGLPPLEAMACGTPVVASNVSCVPEILGKAAVYFDPYEPADIAKTVHTASTKEQKNKEIMVKKGLEQARKYSWKKMAAETLEIYNNVLSV